MLNTQIQFELFATGIPNHRIELKASLVTTLIEAVEPFIKAETLERIEEFLAEQGGAKKSNSAAENLQMQVESLYAEKEHFLGELNTRSLEDVQTLVDSLNDQIVELYREKEGQVIYDGKRIIIEGPRRIIVKK